MFGSLGNLTGLLKQAKELQQRMAEAQARLAETVYDATVGGGLVEVRVNGRMEVVDIRIEEEARNDPEMLPDLIRAGVNAALQKAQRGAQEELAKVTGGLNLPGMQEMLKSMMPQ